MRILVLAVALAALPLACACPEPAAPVVSPTPPPTDAPAPPPQQQAPTTGDAARQLVAPPEHPEYQRVEGTSFANDCRMDADCHVGGCSSEICSAEAGVNSTCEAPAAGWVNKGASCGCVAGQCSWWRAGAAGPKAAEAPLPGQGKRCTADGRCAAGLRCQTYYGIAGANGPAFSSCEISCANGQRCPDGQSCITIADGPGAVCRP